MKWVGNFKWVGSLKTKMSGPKNTFLFGFRPISGNFVQLNSKHVLFDFRKKKIRLYINKNEQKVKLLNIIIKQLLFTNLIAM